MGSWVGGLVCWLVPVLVGWWVDGLVGWLVPLCILGDGLGDVETQVRNCAPTSTLLQDNSGDV